MKAKNNTLKIILAILVIILISLISFLGIFVKDKNKMKNILPEYKLGMDFQGGRVIGIKPDDTVNTEYYDKDGNKVESSSIEEGKEEEYTKKEVPVNEETVLKEENYEKTKKVIEKRLKELNISELEIRENNKNGEIYITIPENTNTDTIINPISTKGDFKIIDANDKTVLLTKDNIRDVKVGVGTSNASSQRTVYLNIQFNKEGTKKLNEISKIYKINEDQSDDEEKIVNEDESTNEEIIANEGETAKEEDTTNETQQVNEETTKKQVEFTLDGETLLSTSFEEEITDGLIQLSMGSESSTNTTSLQEYLNQASSFAVLLKTENMPIEYKVDTNQYVQSDITINSLKMILIFGLIVFAIIALYTIIKYKKLGFYSIISLIGFFATLLIALRYTNVQMAITGIFAIIIGIIMNYIYMLQIIKSNREKKNSFKEISIKYIIIYIPCLIMSIVFSFINYLAIASFGNVMFWTIIIMLIYNTLITRVLIQDSKINN